MTTASTNCGPSPLPAPYSPVEDLQLLEACLVQDCLWVTGLIQLTLEYESQNEGSVPSAAPLNSASQLLLECRQTYTRMLSQLLDLGLDISRFSSLLADLDRLHRLFERQADRLRKASRS